MQSKTINIIKDPKYDFLRVDPLPSIEEVNTYYEKEFYSDTYKRFNDSSKENQKKQRDFHTMRFEDIYSTIQDYFSNQSNLSVFDIGCGYGEMLSFFLEKGFSCSGMEVSTETVAYLKSLGIDAHYKSIEDDFSFIGTYRYDTVLLINVLEHLHNPAKTLLNIKSNALSKKGLLIIDVPNEYNDFQVIANKEYNLNEWWLCPPSHINYFSYDSLCNLLKACGYKICYSLASFPLELFLLFGENYIDNHALGSQCHKKRVLFEQTMRKHNKEKKLRDFYHSLAKLNLGRQITVFAYPS